MGEVGPFWLRLLTFGYAGLLGLTSRLATFEDGKTCGSVISISYQKGGISGFACSHPAEPEKTKIIIVGHSDAMQFFS
jgi:hypothetical protein